MGIKGGFGWDHRSSESKRNLYGWFGVAYGKKSLEEICIKSCFARNLFKFRLNWHTPLFSRHGIIKANVFVKPNEQN